MFSARMVPGMILALALAGGGAARAAAEATTQPAATNPAALEGLINRLGDPDFLVREAAQKALAQVPLSERNTLVQIAVASRNEEIRARLEQQINAMDARIVIDPPPISIDLKDASVAAVADALTKAMGTRFVPPPFDQDRYTLRAVDRPFWEIMQQLTVQHPLWPIDSSNLTRRSFLHTQVYGGVVMTMGRVNVVQNGFGADPHKVTRLALDFNVTVDPRIAVFRLETPVVTMVQDQEGHVLKAVEVGGTMLADEGPASGTPDAHFNSHRIEFEGEVGGKTVSFRGTLKLTSQRPSPLLDPRERTLEIIVPFEFKEIPIDR